MFVSIFFGPRRGVLITASGTSILIVALSCLHRPWDSSADRKAAFELHRFNGSFSDATQQGIEIDELNIDTRKTDADVAAGVKRFWGSCRFRPIFGSCRWVEFLVFFRTRENVVIVPIAEWTVIDRRSILMQLFWRLSFFFVIVPYRNELAHCNYWFDISEELEAANTWIWTN